MRYTYTLTCPTGKRRFATEWMAESALDTIWRMKIKGTVRSATVPCRTHYCKLCKGFHHTSQARRSPDVEG